MTEQNDLFKKFKKIREGTDLSLVTEGAEAAPREAVEPNIDESLELSQRKSADDRGRLAGVAPPDAAATPAIDSLAADGLASGGQAAALLPPARSKFSNTRLLFLVLLVLLVVAGYYLGSIGASPDVSPPSAVVSSVKKLQIPERLVAVETVKEEQVALPPVVTADQVVAEELPQPAAAVTAAVNSSATLAAPAEAVAVPVANYRVLVGPFVSKSSLAKATEQLRTLGFEPQQTVGRGVITMTRLQEGVYPEAEARKRLSKIQRQLADAFMLPSGDKRAIYLGSFSDYERAAGYAAQLTAKGFKVALVASEVEMNGKMLLAVQADQQAAQQAAELISRSGMKTQVVPK